MMKANTSASDPYLAILDHQNTLTQGLKASSGIDTLEQKDKKDQAHQRQSSGAASLEGISHHRRGIDTETITPAASRPVVKDKPQGPMGSGDQQVLTTRCGGIVQRLYSKDLIK